MAITTDLEFLKMCRPMGCHVSIIQAQRRRDFWNQDKEQEAEMEENMAPVLYL